MSSVSEHIAALEAPSMERHYRRVKDRNVLPMDAAVLALLIGPLVPDQVFRIAEAVSGSDGTKGLRLASEDGQRGQELMALDKNGNATIYDTWAYVEADVLLSRDCLHYPAFRYALRLFGLGLISMSPQESHRYSSAIAYPDSALLTIKCLGALGLISVGRPDAELAKIAISSVPYNLVNEECNAEAILAGAGEALEVEELLAGLFRPGWDGAVLRYLGLPGMARSTIGSDIKNYVEAVDFLGKGHEELLCDLAITELGIHGALELAILCSKGPLLKRVIGTGLVGHVFLRMSWRARHMMLYTRAGGASRLTAGYNTDREEALIRLGKAMDARDLKRVLEGVLYDAAGQPDFERNHRVFEDLCLAAGGIELRADRMSSGALGFLLVPRAGCTVRWESSLGELLGVYTSYLYERYGADGSYRREVDLDPSRGYRPFGKNLQPLKRYKMPYDSFMLEQCKDDLKTLAGFAGAPMGDLLALLIPTA